jgi:hypothetical protein
MNKVVNQITEQTTECNYLKYHMSYLGINISTLIKARE